MNAPTNLNHTHIRVTKQADHIGWIVEGLWTVYDNTMSQRDHGWYLGLNSEGELIVCPPWGRGYVQDRAHEGDYFHRRARAALAAHALTRELKKGEQL